MTEDGTGIVRGPQVWFYSRSILYVRFVAEHIEKLYASGKLTNSWYVRILAWGAGVDCRCALLPELDPGAGPDLPALHRQVSVIAKKTRPIPQGKGKRVPQAARGGLALQRYIFLRLLGKTGTLRNAANFSLVRPELPG